MHLKTKKRLYFWLLFIASISFGIGLILYNLSDNISFFLTPTDLITKQVDYNKEIRLGGYVKEGTLVKISIDKIEFEVTDKKNSIKVFYQGPVPLIFREGQGVVAAGVFDKFTKSLDAKYILAKHDERYKPKKIR
ncbi:MAG: cytochrome c maturation protein CcmE [Rickettsiaceae bacterium]|nr:cytochrome c maturation protein CcmE [Rickettsiaceae bacterium]